MRGHESEGIDQEPEILFIFSEKFQEEFEILLPPKDSLAFIAPGNHVIKRPRKMNPWFPCHDFRISFKKDFYQYEIT